MGQWSAMVAGAWQMRQVMSRLSTARRNVLCCVSYPRWCAVPRVRSAWVLWVRQRPLRAAGVPQPGVVQMVRGLMWSSPLGWVRWSLARVGPGTTAGAGSGQCAMEVDALSGLSSARPRTCGVAACRDLDAAH